MSGSARSGTARLAGALGGMTVASGVGMAATPRLVLRIVEVRRREPAPYLVRVIGMYIAASGGLLVDASRAASPEAGETGRGTPVALRWALVMKLGIAAAIVAGVRSGRLGRKALPVAGFDGFAAAVIAKLLVDARR